MDIYYSYRTFTNTHAHTNNVRALQFPVSPASPFFGRQAHAEWMCHCTNYTDVCTQSHTITHTHVRTRKCTRVWDVCASRCAWICSRLSRHVNYVRAVRPFSMRMFGCAALLVYYSIISRIHICRCIRSIFIWNHGSEYATRESQSVVLSNGLIAKLSFFLGIDSRYIIYLFVSSLDTNDLGQAKINFVWKNIKFVVFR